MAIDKNEIEKYIFDPENPKACKSYNLLLNIAKKQPESFFSPEFLQYFFADQIITKEFDDEIWDKPDNYHSLNITEKLDIFKSNYSEEELYEYMKNIFFKDSKINRLSFFKNILDIKVDTCIYSYYFYDYQKDKLKDKLISKILERDNKVFIDFEFSPYTLNTNIIFFSKNNFEILNFYVIKSSIFITLEENIDKFIELNKNQNIKPIFLKKIEDVDLLLNVLENDLKKEKQKSLPKENIKTLTNISIKNFFSINEICLDNLKDKKEIYIVGENGDGKTLLLQAIAVELKGTEEDGLKEFRMREDKFNIEIEYKKNIQNNFFAYGSSRNNACQMKEDNTGYLSLFSGEYDLKSPTKWLQYLDYSEQKENDNVISVKEAKALLNHLLNSDIEIEINPNEVIFSEKGSEVSFEQLSAGYKGVITIICDLIARLSEQQKVENISDFQGVVLIDEVELHLHPKWQYSFMNKLRDTFPLIQFIVTTHSPSVILGASDDAIFYKVYKEEGVTKVYKPMDNIKNLMANVLVTSPLFDMDTARARNSDENIETDEDFIWTKIHQNVAKRVQGKKVIIEDDIVAMVDEEIEAFLEENGL